MIDEAGKVVGPGGLSRNARLARAIADLGIYVRQHHLDGELEQAGRRALEGPPRRADWADVRSRPAGFAAASTTCSLPRASPETARIGQGCTS